MFSMRIASRNNDIFEFLFSLLLDKKKQKEQKQHGSIIEKDGCKIEFSLPCYQCKTDLHLNLAGLTDNLNFQLLQAKLKGSPVIVETNFGQEKGKVKNIGIDYVELKQKDEEIIMILKSQIKCIHIQNSKDSSKSEA